MSRTLGTTSARLALPLAALALLASGCTSSSAGESAATTTAPASTAVAVAASASPGATVAPLPVVAGRDTTDKETKLRVELNELRVSGRVSTLTFTVRNTSAEGGSWQVADFFSDGVTDMAQGQAQYAQDYATVDGVYLLDAAGAKRYLAARSPTKACVCSGSLSDTFVTPGNGVVMSVVFAALPAGTNAVDVVVPHAGTFPAVPVTR